MILPLNLQASKCLEQEEEEARRQMEALERERQLAAEHLRQEVCAQCHSIGVLHVSMALESGKTAPGRERRAGAIAN